MRIRSALTVSVILGGCAGAPLGQNPGVAGLALAPPVDEQIPVVTVAADTGGPEPQMICRDVARPGSRMIIDEVCVPVTATGINTVTREYIQREISGQGWSPGWKTEEQIQDERALSLGVMQPAP